MLVAYAKLALKEDILATLDPGRPVLRAHPGRATSRRRSASSTPTQLAGHPLRREIVTNAVVNSMVNRGGITFAFRAQEETGATPEQVARAFVVCREVFGLADYVRRGRGARQRRADRGADRALPRVPPAARPVGALVPHRRGRRRSTSAPRSSGSSGIVRDLRAAGARAAAGRGEASPRAQGRPSWSRPACPTELALRAASLLDWFSLLDIVDIAADTGREPSDVAPLYYLVSERFGIDAMLGKVTRLPRDDRWDALARGALRDDLYCGAGVADPVGPRGRRPGEPSRPRSGMAWEKANEDSVQRGKTALSAIRRLDHPDIAALSVALRTLALGDPGRRHDLTPHRLPTCIATITAPDAGTFPGTSRGG